MFEIVLNKYVMCTSKHEAMNIMKQSCVVHYHRPATYAFLSGYCPVSVSPWSRHVLSRNVPQTPVMSMTQNCVTRRQLFRFSLIVPLAAVHAVTAAKSAHAAIYATDVNTAKFAPSGDLEKIDAYVL